MSNYLKSRLAIAFSLIIAMYLSVLPLPDGVNVMRPLWIILTIIYWVLALPHRVNIGVAWCSGLCADVLYGSVLGEHALIYTIIAYLVFRMHMRMRLTSGLQQSLTVLLLLVLHQILLLMLQGLQGQAHIHWTYGLPCISSTVLWIWVLLILRDYRRHFDVA